VPCAVYGTVTPCRTTGPRTGLSSVSCETPGGVMVSITLAATQACYPGRGDGAVRMVSAMRTGPSAR
jgi:hypothetical protein